MKKIFEKNGKFYTQRELAKIAGVADCTMSERLNTCKTIEEVINKPKNVHYSYFFEEKWWSRKDIADYAGVKTDTVARYFKKYKTVKNVMNHLRENRYEHNGKLYTYCQIARMYGINEHTFYNRILRMSVDKAIAMGK